MEIGKRSKLRWEGYRKWHRWFAWRPVWMRESETYYWLETVERCNLGFWEYRTVGSDYRHYLAED
jgi:hypothetical protein